jgi:hypothetical protein
VALATRKRHQMRLRRFAEAGLELLADMLGSQAVMPYIDDGRPCRVTW